jgi:spermidine synthase
MASPATLVLERWPGRVRLYLGGDLQFDTADEAIYHERLAHPALAAARGRFAGPLDLLVLGGGDGLLVRELLRHDDVGSVRVVDCNPDVVRLARSELRPFNAGSLDDPRVVVTVADARDVLDSAGAFHAIFADLTFPGTPDDCALFARPWFGRLRTHLLPGGVLALNGLSPERTPAAFWCVYQTLRTCGLAVLPGHFPLPSFAELGYGQWGFFLASDRPLAPEEVLSACRVPGVRTLDPEGLVAGFTFPRALAEARAAARPCGDDGRPLFEALVDAVAAEIGPGSDAVVFLGFVDPFPPREPPEASALSPRLRGWLGRPPGRGLDDLLMAVPLSHRIVTRELVRDWASHLVQVLGALDLRRLVAALLRRAAALPRLLVDELRRFRRLLARGEDPAAHLTTWGWRFFSVLMLVLVLSQTALPSAAYAKGFSSGFHSYGGSSYHSSPYRYHSSGGSSGGAQGADDEETRRVLGLFLLGSGGLVTWLSARNLKPKEGR